MRLALGGLVGSPVVTVVTSILTVSIGDDSPPAMLITTFADGSPDDYQLPGMALYLLYGTGYVYGLLAAAGLLALGSPTALTTGLANGLVSTRSSGPKSWSEHRT